MKQLVLSVLLFFLLLAPSCRGQQQPPKPSEDPQTQLNQFLAQRHHEESGTLTLSDCSERLREWESWANVNVPKHDELIAEYDSLATENTRLNKRIERQSWVVMKWLFWIAAGLGAGTLATFAVIKSVRRSWPLSAPRKQLFVLISGATWITAATLFATLNGLASHPINLFAAVTVYSLPAILFGGVSFWWIGKSEAI